ncbi:hypothetical protein ILYODFUR_003384 [Ilyodon furcidens]|uniref:Uncharacterized protein n=1 Tax=Ilyodon furcidens TaxID=33524 RepID=A0ABV0U3M2_9TELE
MSFCQQRDISVLGLPYPGPAEEQWKRQDVARAMLLFGQWRHRKSAVTPFPGCAGSNAIYFESSRKVRTAFPVVTHGCGSQHRLGEENRFKVNTQAQGSKQILTRQK